MYKVRILQNARNVIEGYILAYRNGFIRLYDDTGSGYTEDIIKKQYITSAQIIGKSLYEVLSVTMNPDKFRLFI